MLKKLGPYARPYSKWIAVGVLCSAAEAIFELLIPLVMARIVDVGIQKRRRVLYCAHGRLMVAMALVSLGFGISAAYLSAKTGQGFEPICALRSMTVFRNIPSAILNGFPPLR